MDFFMPAERVLYDRSYFFSDEALEEYTAEVADQNGVDIDEVASSSELMDKVRWEIDNAIERDLSDEICNFDCMLDGLKRGDDPEHPAEISVVAKGTVERWDKPSRGLVVADSLLSLVQGTGSVDALKGEDAGLRFASVCEAKTWCHQYSLRELAETEKKPEPAEAAAAAKRAAGCTGGDDAGNAGAIKL